MTVGTEKKSRDGRAARDPLGFVALAAAVLSLLGFVVLAVGRLLDPSTFNNGKHPGGADYAAFYAYVIGLLIALLLGGAVWFHGRRHSRVGRRSPAALATWYGAGALAVAVIVAALGG